MMKKASILFSGLLLAGFTAQAQYQEAKLDVGGLIATNFGLGYEYGINDEMGINARIGYFSSGSLIDSDYDYNAFTITADYRYYFNPDEGCDGYFVSGYLKYRSITAENYYSWFEPDPNGGQMAMFDDYKSNGIGFGITSGRKWVTRGGFLYESYVGVGRYLIESAGDPPIGYSDYWGDFDPSNIELPWDFRIGLIIGYRFAD